MFVRLFKNKNGLCLVYFCLLHIVFFLEVEKNNFSIFNSFFTLWHLWMLLRCLHSTELSDHASGMNKLLTLLTGLFSRSATQQSLSSAGTGAMSAGGNQMKLSSRNCSRPKERYWVEFPGTLKCPNPFNLHCLIAGELHQTIGMIRVQAVWHQE